MVSLKNDYSETCHPRILEALASLGKTQYDGYSTDRICEQARQLIREGLQCPNASVFFVSGGTQANLVVIASLLKPFESVICAETGHIQVHEAGAIEATGHKVHNIPSLNGKVSLEDIAQVLEEHTNVPHMVKPRLVYLSNSTELGTIYQKKEVEALSEYCKSHNLYLFIDGARIANALTAQDNDLTLEDLTQWVDAFTLGGTKNGGLFGEAIVFPNPTLSQDFGFHLKQRGALLAKGWVVGVQFRELFRDGLYFELASHANRMAMRLSEALQIKGCSFLVKPQTNQIFPVLKEPAIQTLSQKIAFYRWKKTDPQSWALRWVTSWATSENQIKDCLRIIQSVSI
ncbi:MAG: aminotransferase class V-fold PLP-dependent enzyme [Spirochaetales bacterium]